MRQLHRLIDLINEKFIALEREYFTIWKAVCGQLKEAEQEQQKNSLIHKVIEVLKTSKRGKRSLVEEEILSKYLVTIACVPKLTAAELKKLSNEVDWIDCSGRTLIFLQGDYGNCFYMIAQGNIDLFLETSKDKEMANCRKFGDLRGKMIQSDDCDELGKKITTLSEGKGFGEYAILSKTHKFRGATAVTTDQRSLLLVVLEETYNTVFRKHHFRQAQMSSAMSLLKDIPAFNWYSYSKMSQIAYNLKSQTYHGRMTIIRAGQPVTNILLVHTGRIKVVDTSHNLMLSQKSENHATTSSSTLASPRSLLTKHVSSPLYVRELGRGQLIGETEVLKGLDTFEMSYQACGACEVFELPREYFEEVMNASRLALHDVEDSNELLDYRASLRLHDLSEVTQLLRPQQQSPRRGASEQPPFRTYAHHEAHRVPINRPTQAKPPATISTYDEIRDAALSREAEHNQKVERVRRLMMDMSTGSPTSPFPPLSSPSMAISTSLSSSIQPSPSSFSLTSPTKSPPKKSKNKTPQFNDSPSLLEEYEMMDDLRALLPLFSGSITENFYSPTKTVSSKSVTKPSNSGVYKSLPALSPSTAQPPSTPNTYSIHAIKNVTTSMTKFDRTFSSTGRPLVITASSNLYSPPSNAIIEQYHRSIGRSELIDSTSFFHQTPNISTPNDPRQISSGEMQDGLAMDSPMPPPRPPRDSFENRLIFEPKTVDELLYDEEMKKLKSETVITGNPFEALGLPSTAVFRSPNENKTREVSMKPHPPSSISPSKGNFTPNRRSMH